MRTCPNRPRPGAIGVLAYLLVAVIVTACDREATPGPPPARPATGALIAVVGASETHPQWPGIRGGAQRYFAAAPTVRNICSAPRDSSAPALDALVEQVLERKPAVVCLQVADVNRARSCIERLAAAQILVVTMGTRCDAPAVAHHVSVDWTGGAELLGANLTRAAAGRRSYILVHESGDHELATTCRERFDAALERQYDLTLLEAVHPTVERPAAKVIEDVLERFPHAGLLVALNPDPWLAARAGWSRDLHALNREFRFATLSAAPVLWRQLGTPAAPGDAAALVGPLDGEIGYLAAEVAARMLLSPATSYTHPTISCELVLREGLPDFAQRYSAAAGGLDVSTYLPK